MPQFENPVVSERMVLVKQLDESRRIQAICVVHSLGKQAPRFSITGRITNPALRDGIESTGAIHEDILKHFPHLAPLVELHLSTLDGQPLYAVENGWYWAGGTRWNGIGDNAPPNANHLASHLRISEAEANRLAAAVTGDQMSKLEFVAFVEAQKPRWAAEAEQGLNMLRSPPAVQPVADLATQSPSPGR